MIQSSLSTDDLESKPRMNSWPEGADRGRLTAKSSFASLAAEGRKRRALKIVEILANFVDLLKAEVLDIGTGSGHIAGTLAQHAKTVVSVDVLDQRVCRDGYVFREIDSENLPFEPHSFDMVVSNQVIEHTLHPNLHLSEIARVLRPGGIAYLSTPNRFSIIEPHTRLPFLSWFPAPLAQLYFRSVRGRSAEWNVHTFSYRRLSHLIRPLFEQVDMVPAVMKEPVRYHQMKSGWQTCLVARSPAFLWSSRFNLFLPSFMIVLRPKPGANPGNTTT